MTGLMVAVLFCMYLGVEGDCKCLSSRPEVYPCNFRHDSTSKPGANEYGDYHVAITPECHCEIKNSSHVVKALPSISGSLFILKSPNKLASQQEKKYKNNKLTWYNVNCSRGDFISFYVSVMDLESWKCFNQRSRSSKCVDYIQLRNSHDKVIAESCGRNAGTLNRLIHDNSMRVIFRSNYKKRFPGFEAAAYCYSPKTCMEYQSSIIEQNLQQVQSCPSYLSSSYQDEDMNHMMELSDDGDDPDLEDVYDLPQFMTRRGTCYDSDNLNTLKTSSKRAFNFFGMNKNEEFLIRVYLTAVHHRKRKVPKESQDSKCKLRTVKRMMDDVMSYQSARNEVNL